METVKVKALKINLEHYCSKEGPCERGYICINPKLPLDEVCPYFIVKATNRKTVEAIEEMKRKRRMEER